MEKIKVYGCRYIYEYSDGLALSSAMRLFRTRIDRLNFLFQDYESDEIDIDTSNHERGWEFFEMMV